MLNVQIVSSVLWFKGRDPLLLACLLHLPGVATKFAVL